jgi:hypothetical protein
VIGVGVVAHGFAVTSVWKKSGCAKTAKQAKELLERTKESVLGTT